MIHFVKITVKRFALKVIKYHFKILDWTTFFVDNFFIPSKNSKKNKLRVPSGDVPV